MSDNAITQYSSLPSVDQWRVMQEQAAVLVKSRLLPQHVDTPEKAIAIIQKGTELGIRPMHALSNIAVIQGKPTANAELMLALIYRDHGDDAVRIELTTPQECRIAYKRRSWKEPERFSFTMDDAKRASLSGTNWSKYPAAMLRARCISAVARMAFPDSIGGMYTPEELGAAPPVDESDASVIDVTPLGPPNPALTAEKDTEFRVEQKCEVCGEIVATVSADALEHLRLAKGLGWVVIGKKPSKWYCPEHASQAQAATTPTMASTSPKPAPSATNAPASGDSASSDEERRQSWLKTIKEIAAQIEQEYGIPRSDLREQWTEKLKTPEEWHKAPEYDLRRILRWLEDEHKRMKTSARQSVRQGATA